MCVHVSCVHVCVCMCLWVNVCMCVHVCIHPKRTGTFKDPSTPPSSHPHANENAPAVVMDFREPATGQRKALLLPARSALALQCVWLAVFLGLMDG